MRVRSISLQLSQEMSWNLICELRTAIMFSEHFFFFWVNELNLDSFPVLTQFKWDCVELNHIRMPVTLDSFGFDRFGSLRSDPAAGQEDLLTGREGPASPPASPELIETLVSVMTSLLGLEPPLPGSLLWDPCRNTHTDQVRTHTQTLHSIPPSPHFSAFTTDICLCMRLLIMQHKDKMYITETVMHFFVTVSHSSCKCYLGVYHGGLRSYLNQCI